VLEHRLGDLLAPRATAWLPRRHSTPFPRRTSDGGY
jgi:hypothetical protein